MSTCYKTTRQDRSFLLLCYTILFIRSDNCKLFIHAWYLDDQTIIGDWTEMTNALNIVQRDGSRIDLKLNIYKINRYKIIYWKIVWCMICLSVLTRPLYKKQFLVICKQQKFIRCIVVLFKWTFLRGLILPSKIK